MATQAFVRQPKAYDVVSAACIQQGLPPPQGAVFGSDDITFQQMAATLNLLGMELIGDWVWPQFVRTVDIVIPDPGQPRPDSLLVDMPADFDRWIDDTGWNKDSRGAMSGPAGEQSWQTLKQFLGNGILLAIMWRAANETQFEVMTPNVGQTFSLRYVSRGWVRDDVDMIAYRDHVEKDSDHLYFDQRLLELGLIYKFRERKGFEVTAEKRDYEYRRDRLLGALRGGTTLDLVRRRTEPLIGIGNVPAGGYGQQGPAGPTGMAGPVGATGPMGPMGYAVLHGHGPPAADLGRDGDFYIDEDAWDIYGPKTAGVWRRQGKA